MPASAAVTGGTQDLNARGDTPSTLADVPLRVTRAPSTGMTARTPLSTAILATWAAVNPPGIEATRSGTTSRLGVPMTPVADVVGVPRAGAGSCGHAAS